MDRGQIKTTTKKKKRNTFAKLKLNPIFCSFKKRNLLIAISNKNVEHQKYEHKYIAQTLIHFKII